MSHLRRHFIVGLLLTLLAPGVSAQQEPARLRPPDAFRLYRQIADLMEASSIAVPELARAGAPLTENVRQAAEALQVGATREHAGVLYRLLVNARIYLDISHAVPKPNPFAGEVRQQLTKLREAVDRAEVHFRSLLDAKENRLRDPDRDNLKRYAEENQRLGAPSPSEKRVIFLGDSITDGWRLNQYFPGKPYVNRGIGGQITGQMLGRMQADVLDLQPKAVVVLAGTNDIARGVSTKIIKDNLRMIADLATANNVKPVFASILPVSDYHKEKDPNYEMTRRRPPTTILELNQWIHQMCKARGLIYLDYYSAMVDSDGQLQADLADDGLHPNANGYRLMAPLAGAAIDSALRAPPPPRRRKKRLGIF